MLYFSTIISVYKTGNKKSKSSYFFISNKCEYLRVHSKSMNWDMHKALQSCKLRIWGFL